AASVSRSCTDTAGNSASDSVSLKYDAKIGRASGRVGRTADHNGWYNHAVGYGVSAKSDATSGIDSCDPDATYSGPDNSAASVSRSCTDTAGNSASDSVSLKYDATAASVTVALARRVDHNGWYNHAVGYGVSAKSDATSGID